MPYIGKIPAIGNYQVLDALTATTTDTYALTKNSVAVFPQTPANCIVSLNGVIQAPFSSYTISGSNIVFASALAGSDSIDFITVLGDVLNVGTVSDGTIGLAKLSATGTKDSTTFLRGDNTFAEVPAGGITEADQWRTTTDNTYNTDDIVSLNWERTDSAFWTDDYIGTGLTEASGVFTIPTTGMYFLSFNFKGSHPSTTFSFMNIIPEYDDGTGYSIMSSVATENYNNGASAPQNLSSSLLINASDSNRKFRFRITMDNNGYNIEGQTTRNETGFQIMRIGDAV